MRLLSKILFCFSLLFVLTGCDTLAGGSSEQTFTVSTGDLVRVKMERKSGYLIFQKDNGFTIGKGNDVVVYGSFLTEDMYQGLWAAGHEKNVRIIDEGDNYCKFELKTNSETGYYYLQWLDSGNGTGVSLNTTRSEEEFEDIMSKITIERK